jgi:hypothetical protein
MSTALLALIAQRKQQSQRLKTIKPSINRNRYRVLPSWRVIANAPTMLSDEEKALWAEQFYADFGQHFIKDAAGQVKAVYVCVDKTFGRTCQICDELARGIENSVDDIQKKRLEDAKASARVLLNVLHLDGPTPNEVQVLELAPSAFFGKKGVGGVFSLFKDWPNMTGLKAMPGRELVPSEEKRQLFGIDPDTVYGPADIIVDKAGTGLETVYGVSAVPASSTVTRSI